jgi:multisubunit Na+/H+ antiporter MnhB subunit
MISLLVALVAAIVHDPRMLHALPAALSTVTESTPGIMIGLLICASSLTLPLTESRFIRVLLLGTCGFAMVAMYVIYQAPDLALTQLFFEIISVLLFVFVLRLLPSGPIKREPARIPRIIIAASSGLTLAWVTLLAATTNPVTHLATPLGEFFIMNTYYGETPEALGRGGGGFNIVNVILVDFRGFDTMAEIGVLGIAAIGVWSMLFRKDAETVSKVDASI